MTPGTLPLSPSHVIMTSGNETVVTISNQRLLPSVHFDNLLGITAVCQPPPQGGETSDRPIYVFSSAGE